MEVELLSATPTETSPASVSERIKAASKWISVVFGNLLGVKRVFSCVELSSHLIISKHFKSSSNVKPLLLSLFELLFVLKLLINISHDELSVYIKLLTASGLSFANASGCAFAAFSLYAFLISFFFAFLLTPRIL